MVKSLIFVWSLSVCLVLLLLFVLFSFASICFVFLNLWESILSSSFSSSSSHLSGLSVQVAFCYLLLFLRCSCLFGGCWVRGVFFFFFFRGGGCWWICMHLLAFCVSIVIKTHLSFANMTQSL